MKKLPTVNIKGKEYVQVVERVKEFHNLHPLGQIVTEIVESGPNRVSVKATVKIPSVAKITDQNFDNMELQKKIDLAHRFFTGHSQAEWGKGMMGDVALEIAETSAVGRALGFANIGLLDTVASVDEINKATAPANGDKGADDEKRLIYVYEHPKSEAQKKWAKSQLVAMGHDFDETVADAGEQKQVK